MTGYAYRAIMIIVVFHLAHNTAAADNTVDDRELDLIFVSQRNSLSRLTSVDMEYSERWEPSQYLVDNHLVPSHLRARTHVHRYSEKGDMYRYENDCDEKRPLPGSIGYVYAFNRDKFQLFQKDNLHLTVRSKLIPKTSLGNVPLHQPYKYIFTSGVVPGTRGYYRDNDEWDGSNNEAVWNALKPFVSKVESGECNGHSCRIVEFDFSFKNRLRRVYCAEEYEYYPIKVESINQANGIRTLEVVTDELTRVDTPEGVVYVPTHMYQNEYHDSHGYKLFSIDKTVDKSRMRINSDIPDALFTIPIHIAKTYSDDDDIKAHYSMDRVADKALYAMQRDVTDGDMQLDSKSGSESDTVAKRDDPKPDPNDSTGAPRGDAVTAAEPQASRIYYIVLALFVLSLVGYAIVSKKEKVQNN